MQRVSVGRVQGHRQSVQSTDSPAMSEYRVAKPRSCKPPSAVLPAEETTEEEEVGDRIRSE